MSTEQVLGHVPNLRLLTVFALSFLFLRKARVYN